MRAPREDSRRSKKAPLAQSQLSAQLGEVQLSGFKSEVPADMTRESPAPVWMPRTTGTGTIRPNHRRSPVRLSSVTMPPMKSPAPAVSSLV